MITAERVTDEEDLLRRITYLCERSVKVFGPGVAESVVVTAG